MAGAPRYPVHLDMEGRQVLVVGGGAVAVRRVRQLLACAAHVTVVARRPHQGLAQLQDEVDGPAGRVGALTVEQRSYRRGEAAHYGFVVAATDDVEVNRLVCADAEEAGLWSNNVSLPDGGAVATPAVLRRGAVVVSVGTGGAGPGLAVWLRDHVAALLGPEVGVLAELVSDERRAARSDPAVDVLPDWRPALDSGMLDLIRHGRILEAKERLSACRSSSSG